MKQENDSYLSLNSRLQQKYQSLADLPNEIWKDISNFPNYKISNYGRVKSIGRYITYTISGIKCTRWIMEKILISRMHKGSVRVYIQRNYHTVSRLVLYAFYGIDEKSAIHLNGNKFDNRLSNLQYMSHKTTTLHNYNIGLDNNKRIAQYCRDNKVHVKVSPEQINEIRRLYQSNNYTQKELAAKFEVHKDTIGYIIRGQKRDFIEIGIEQ